MLAYPLFSACHSCWYSLSHRVTRGHLERRRQSVLGGLVVVSSELHE